jgi:hypothetical protein
MRTEHHNYSTLKLKEVRDLVEDCEAGLIAELLANK